MHPANDFGFLVGAWTTVQRRLTARGVGSTEWKDSPPNVHCATHYLDGAVTMSRKPLSCSAGASESRAGGLRYTQL
jgi:hypothetical protein